MSVSPFLVIVLSAVKKNNRSYRDDFVSDIRIAVSFKTLVVKAAPRRNLRSFLHYKKRKCEMPPRGFTFALILLQ